MQDGVVGEERNIALLRGEVAIKRDGVAGAAVVGGAEVDVAERRNRSGRGDQDRAVRRDADPALLGVDWARDGDRPGVVEKEVAGAAAGEERLADVDAADIGDFDVAGGGFGGEFSDSRFERIAGADAACCEQVELGGFDVEHCACSVVAVDDGTGGFDAYIAAGRPDLAEADVAGQCASRGAGAQADVAATRAGGVRRDRALGADVDRVAGGDRGYIERRSRLCAKVVEADDVGVAGARAFDSCRLRNDGVETDAAALGVEVAGGDVERADGVVVEDVAGREDGEVAGGADRANGDVVGFDDVDVAVRCADVESADVGVKEYALGAVG